MTVHVVGNACIDLSFWLAGAVPAGATVLARRWQKGPGGKGLNQATAAARVGAAVVLWAAVGDDTDAELIQAHLVAEGISLEGLAYQAGPTDLSAIWVGPDGDNRIVSAAGQAASFRPAADPLFAAALRPGDVVAGQGNLQPAATEAVLALARERGARTALNPSPPRDGGWPDLAAADLVVLNVEEAQAIAGAAAPEDALARLRTMTAGAVVLTLGPAGALLSDAAAEMRAVSTPLANAVDTSGAGDALFGTMLALWADGWPLGKALAAAVRVASRKVERPGALAGLPPAAEVRDLIGQGMQAEAGWLR
ncbi:MAG: PfkB family carbohydrate kinase [Alphaproteobacteria bacterium]